MSGTLSLQQLKTVTDAQVDRAQDDNIAKFLSHLSIIFPDISPDVLFELVDNQLERISFRKVPAETLAAVLRPYVDVENISLDLFIDNPKYIKAAYHLGVRKFKPRFKDDNLALAIYENENLIPSEKYQLFEWLLQQNCYETNPLPLKTIYSGLIEGKDLSFGCFLRHFPSIDDSQIEGYIPPANLDADSKNKSNNILHAAVYHGGILKMWKSLLKMYSAEEIVQMLLEVNPLDRSALFLIVSNYFNHSNRMPKEILLAFISIAKSGDFQSLNYFGTIPMFESSNVSLLLYKYGMTPDKIPPIQQGHTGYYYQQPKNIFEIVHNEYRYKNEKKDDDSDKSRNEQNSAPSSDNFPIDQMIPEIVWMIADYLDSKGLVGLFTATKSMTSFIITKNDKFWRQFYERNVRPNSKINNYKAMILQDAIASTNWIERNFNRICLDGYTATPLMDENWLALMKGHDLYLWDCHTQKIHWICKTYPEFVPLRILGGTYNGICPPILMQQKNRVRTYILAFNGEWVRLHEYFDFPEADALSQHGTEAYQIDENVILAPNGVIYDIQSESILDPTIVPSEDLVYNPFNHTYMILLRKHCFEIYDMNRKLIRQFNTKNDFTTGHFVFLNEFTLFWRDNVRSYMLIDFKETEIVEKLIRVDHSTASTCIMSCSMNRAILADSRTGLVTICHVPSMQWEAVYHVQAQLIAANTRYLVGNQKGSAVIYDFYK